MADLGGHRSLPIASCVKGLAGTLGRKHVQIVEGQRHVGSLNIAGAADNRVVNATRCDISNRVM